MNLTAGKFESDKSLTSGSMSAEIERAMNALVPLGASENPVGRRKLCLAIARGTLKHMREAGPIQVSVQVGGQTVQLSAQITVDLGDWS